jgi:tetratricopeptide (TPR) repeat protein
LTSQGELKITDFGLAKLLAVESDLTTENSLLGTPSYMPPEQASGDGRPASREGDVYSLGAILYELLTGRPPFIGVTLLETLSLIRERSPVPPRALQPRVPRDLETICLKCLDKTPERRYSTAAALAADLKRFLEGSPILARRPPWSEKAWRWCRRNPAIAALAAGLTLAVTGGFVGVVWQWNRAESALRSESVARSAAIDRAREVEAGLERLKLANGFLDRGYAFVEWRRWDDAEICFTKAIELRPDHVPAWEARGRSLYARLGLWDLAAADSLKSFQLQEPTVAGGRRWWWHALLRLRENDVAGYKRMCARMLKRFEGGEREGVSCDFARALLLLPATADIKLLVDLAEIPTSNASRDASYYYIQAIAQYRAGNYEAAIARCRQSLAAEVNTFRPELNYAVLAMAQGQLDQTDEARKSYDQLVAEMRHWMDQRYADGPDSWSITLGATGIWPVSCWDWLECEHYMREVADTLGIEPPEVDARSHVLRARAFAGLRRSSNAVDEYDDALRHMPNDIQVQLESHRARALYLVHLKDYRAAADEFGKASALEPDDARLLDAEAITLAATGEMDGYRQACAKMMDRFDSSSDSDAANEVTHACVIRPDALPDMNRLIPLARVAATHYVGSVRMLGSAQYRAGQYREAIESFEEAAKLGRVTPFDWYFLAMAHYRLGHADDARRMLANAAAWIDKADHRDPNDLSGSGPSWGGWDEKVTVPMLRSEAETLVLGNPEKAKAADP